MIKINFFIKIFIILVLIFITHLYLYPFLWDWFFSDDYIQFNLVQDRGLFGSVLSNLYQFSIGRPTSIAWINFFFYIFNILNFDPWYGLIFYKYITVLCVIFLLSLFFSIFFYKEKFLNLIIISLIFFNIYLINGGLKVFLGFFGVDSALQFCPFIFFIILLYFSKKLTLKISKKNNILFFLSFFLYLNTNYTSLFFGGLFILFYFINFQNLKKLIALNIFNFLNFHKRTFQVISNFNLLEKDKIKIYQFNFGLYIFLISFLIQSLSPSVFIREKIWPSDISVIAAIKNSLPLIEIFIIHIWSWSYLFVLFACFVLKVFCIDKFFLKFPKGLILLLIFYAPMNLFLTNTLTYLSSTLHVPISLIMKDSDFPIYIFEILRSESWALHPRHIININIFALVSYSTIGFVFGNYIKNKLVNRNEKNR